MSAKKSNKKKDIKDISNLRQEAERKKNMKIAKQTLGPSPTGNKQLATGTLRLRSGKFKTDEQESDGSANAFKDK